MSQNESGTLESTEALFDVVVHLPSGMKLETVLERAINDAGIEPAKAEALVNALKSVPSAKVGASVTRARADKARSDLTKAGLHVEVTPVLTLQAAIHTEQDSRYRCPACNAEVELDDKRQCPACGVFVDKVTDDFLLRRKIMEQEKAKLDYANSKEAKDMERRNKEAREAAIRKQVREELEKELGLDKKPSLLDRFPNLVRGVGTVVLLAIGFSGGKLLSGGSFGGGAATTQAAAASPESAKAAQAADVDKMLDKLGDKATAGSPADLTADPDIEDSLLQAGADRRAKGKSISVEQAVAASKALAASVGHKMPGEGKAGGGGGGAAAAGGDSAAAAADAAVGGAGGAGAEQATVSPALKAELTLEFARDLAEMGQAARAREVIKSLSGSPVVKGDAALAAHVKIAEFEVQAWSLRGGADTGSRQLIDSIRIGAGSIADPTQRTLALAAVAGALARHPTMPPEPATAFLTLANDAMKDVTDANQRTVAASALVSSLGYSLLSEVGRRARAGEWSKAKAAAAQLEGLAKDAPTADAAVRLIGLDSQSKLIMGNNGALAHNLDAAIALINKQGSLELRARLLRVLAQASDAPGHEKLRNAVAQLTDAALAKTGREKAVTLATISVLHADAGLPDRAEALRKEALESQGLSPADAAQIEAQALVRSELGVARAAHSIRAYAQAEAQLQKVADYLL